MTSDFLTRPVPVERFQVIYASAENLGAAGLCVSSCATSSASTPAGLPAAFSYTVQPSNRAVQYTTDLHPVCRCIDAAGSNNEAAQGDGNGCSRQKSALLYRYIDNGDLHCPQKIRIARRSMSASTGRRRADRDLS
ncbi:hypothetical protein [Stutzerimonas xanthomarina]|uniref:hypothetical protein n=1 Tax=Stutzerimonas xanthomarina TaxID=271420 RepID=UPI003AA93AA9